MTNEVGRHFETLMVPGVKQATQVPASPGALDAIHAGFYAQFGKRSVFDCP
jgi:hypothetical protein